MDNSFSIDSRESAWKALYISGGVAALVAVIIFRRFFAVELVAFNGFGIFDVPPNEPVGNRMACST